MISSTTVIDSVEGQPRHHLGSTVYEPSLEPPAVVTKASAKFGFLSTPRPLPRFEGKYNCTFNIRVPKLYLQRVQREEICRRRALWGVDVYTDDSDPLAAAIHCGWIQGDWGDETEFILRHLYGERENKLTDDEQNTQASYDSPPARPWMPPRGKDLIITVLILPQLEKYGRCVANGIASRPWGHKHDGNSFKILSIAWASPDHGGNTGAARRARLNQYLDEASFPGPVVKVAKSVLKKGNPQSKAISAAT